MQHITSHDGTRIGYQHSGTGPPLLLVHGTTAAHGRWSPIVPRLGRRSRCMPWTEEGGGKAATRSNTALIVEAEDVVAVLDAIGEAAFVLGHSHGALCCVEASLLTDGIRKLVLYEPPIPTGTPFCPPALLDRIQQRIDEGELEAALELFIREVVGVPKMSSLHIASCRRGKRASGLCRQFPRTGFRRTIDFRRRGSPTCARRPCSCSAATARRFSRKGIAALDAALPVSRIAIMPGQRHIAMDTAPDLFLGEVEGFPGP